MKSKAENLLQRRKTWEIPNQHVPTSNENDVAIRIYHRLTDGVFPFSRKEDRNISHL